MKHQEVLNFYYQALVGRDPWHAFSYLENSNILKGAAGSDIKNLDSRTQFFRMPEVPTLYLFCSLMPIFIERKKKTNRKTPNNTEKPESFGLWFCHYATVMSTYPIIKLHTDLSINRSLPLVRNYLGKGNLEYFKTPKEMNRHSELLHMMHQIYWKKTRWHIPENNFWQAHHRLNTTLRNPFPCLTS